jgi:outer membrane protein assembly factor BamE (lipoprotein component of BamABCDE complex)
MIMAGKTILCILLSVVLVCSLSGCHQAKEKDINEEMGVEEIKEKNIYEGMSFEEFKEINPEESYFQYYGGYLFGKTNDGDHYVAQLSDDCRVISKVSCYEEESIDDSDATFEKIKEGMTVEQVVSMVGIPEGSYTSGMITLAFRSNTEAQYWVYFRQASTEKPTEYYVSSVNKFN